MYVCMYVCMYVYIYIYDITIFCLTVVVYHYLIIHTFSGRIGVTLMII